MNPGVTWTSAMQANFNNAITRGVNGPFTLPNGQTVTVTTSVIDSWMNRVGMLAGHGAGATSVYVGYWHTEELPGGTPEFMALHEALHLLGVQDHYTRGPHGEIVPDEGYKNDVMGGVRGGVSAADIAEIIASNGKGVAGKLISSFHIGTTGNIISGSAFTVNNWFPSLTSAGGGDWLTVMPGGNFGGQPGEGSHPVGQELE